MLTALRLGNFKAFAETQRVEALEIDLSYDTNLASTILSVEEYQQNRDYSTPFYRNVERESLPL